MKTVDSRLTRVVGVVRCVVDDGCVLCEKAWMSDLELSLFNGWYDPVVRASPDLVRRYTPLASIRTPHATHYILSPPTLKSPVSSLSPPMAGLHEPHAWLS